MKAILTDYPTLSVNEEDDCTTTLLHHIARYRLTVLEVLRQLPLWKALSHRDTHRLLRQLRQHSLLASAPLYHGRTYWYLTAHGAQRCGLIDYRADPISEQAKIRAFAILSHCCLSSAPRHRLNRNELRRHFPALYEPGLPSSYVFNPENQGRLELVRVDAGHPGRWDRVIESLRKDVSRHWTHPGFREVVQAGRFEIALLTALPQKAQRVSQALQSHRDIQRIPVSVTALPALLPLISSLRRKEAAPPPD